jgi:hypothetical protein
MKDWYSGINNLKEVYWLYPWYGAKSIPGILLLLPAVTLDYKMKQVLKTILTDFLNLPVLNLNCFV